MIGIDVKKNVIVTISSDKGLYGGINSTAVKISKVIHMLNSGAEKERKYVILGEKEKAQLIRDSKKDIELTITELQKNPLNYTQEMYKKAAEFWAELRVELLSASTVVPDEKPNSGQLWRLYWSSHQRFVRHMCMSAKVPVAVRLAKQALKENKCVVIGLQSTGEAWTEEAVTKYGVEMDGFVSGPRELLA